MGKNVCVRAESLINDLCVVGWALCGHETPDLEESDNQVSKCAGSKHISNDSAAHQHVDGKPTGPPADCEEAAGQNPSAHDPGVPSSIEPDNHVNTLSRSDRVQIGQKCKRLIDFGRQQWMSAQGFKVRISLWLHAPNGATFWLKPMHTGMSSYCSAASACRLSTDVQGCCMQVKSVLYISPEISGENRLLLATLQCGAALPTTT